MTDGVSILIPTIRPDGANRCVAAIYENAGIDPKRFEINADMDWNRIGCPQMVKKMVATSRFPWVCFLGDDTIPQKDFLKNALAYASTLPDGWGLVGLNDCFHKHYPATHWLAHKNLLPLLGGEFFSTDYIHCYCDIELTERCEGLGRYIWAEEARLIHDHPLLQGKPLTGDYERVYSPAVKTKDLQTYYLRKRKGWKNGNGESEDRGRKGSWADDSE